MAANPIQVAVMGGPPDRRMAVFLHQLAYMHSALLGSAVLAAEAREDEADAGPGVLSVDTVSVARLPAPDREALYRRAGSMAWALQGASRGKSGKAQGEHDGEGWCNEHPAPDEVTQGGSRCRGQRKGIQEAYGKPAREGRRERPAPR